MSLRCPQGAPPKWKMAVVTGLGIYPLVVFVFPLVASWTAGLAPWLARLVTVALATPLMTWAITPLLTRLLHNWLYPADPGGP